MANSLFVGLASAEDKITYNDHILPIFKNICLNCHNPDKLRAGLDLSSYQKTLTGSTSAQVIEPGDPDASLLYLLVAHEAEPHMPLKSGKLPDEQLDLIKRWIEGGVLESAGSTAVVSDKPKLDLTISAAPDARPEGPPPMPVDIVREPVVRAARPGAIQGLAASPWAPLVALGGQEQVLLYHLQTRQLLGVLPLGTGAMPQVIRFSRSGKLLIVGGGEGARLGKVSMFDVITGKHLTDIGEEYDAVLACDISPDQSQIALGGPNKMLKFFTTADGAMRAKIAKHTDWVTAVAFSPDGVLLASADRNGGLRVWEAVSHNEFYTLAGHAAAVTALRYRADSNILISASEDGTVKLWDMSNGAEAKSFTPHGGAGVLGLDVAPDGRIATAGRDKVVRLWNADGSAIRDFDAFADIALNVAFTDDGAHLAAGDYTGQVRVYAIADGALAGQMDLNPPTIAERLAAAEKVVAELQPAYASATSQVTAATQAAQQAAAELAAAQAKADAAAKAAADAKAASDQATTQMNAAQAEVAKIKADQARAALEQAQSELTARTTEHQQLDAEMKSTQATIDAARSAIVAEETRIAEAPLRMKTLDDRLSASQQKMDEAETAMQAAVAEEQAAREAQAAEKADAEAAPARLEALKQSMISDETDAKMSEKQDALNVAGEAVTAAQARVDQLTTELAQLREQAGLAPTTAPGAP